MPTNEQDNPYRSPAAVEIGRKRDGSFWRDLPAALCVAAVLGVAIGLDLWVMFPCGTLTLGVLLMLFVWAKLRKWPRFFGLAPRRVTWVELVVLVVIYGMLMALLLPPVNLPHPAPRRLAPSTAPVDGEQGQQ